MADITLIINNTDYSAYIQQTQDITETLRKIYGKAHGYAVDGTTIPNLIAKKWDPSFMLKPLPQSMAEQLIDLMEMETVTLQYTSVKHGEELREITALPLSMTVNYATYARGERVYQPTVISFEEQ